MKLNGHPDKIFKYYRMTVSSFDELVNLIGPFILRQDTKWKRAIPPEERLSITLRYIATGESFYSLSYQYLVGVTTVRDIVKTTCCQLWNTLQPIYVATKTEKGWIDIADEFYKRCNFPIVIGAIDGKHIRIKQPDNTGSEFYNYKKYFSCILMAWTDADYKFINIDVGAYGSSSDSTVFSQSNMGKRFEDNSLNLPHGRKLPNDDSGKIIPFYLVADEAFGLSNAILRPYAKNHLTYNKRIYNYRHTRARRMVECTFGILANKWRILHQPLVVGMDLSVIIIKACCILHNFVRIKDGVTFSDTLYSSALNTFTLNEDQRGQNFIGGMNVRSYLTSYFVTPQGSVPWQYAKV